MQLNMVFKFKWLYICIDWAWIYYSLFSLFTEFYQFRIQIAKPRMLSGECHATYILPQYLFQIAVLTKYVSQTTFSSWHILKK